VTEFNELRQLRETDGVSGLADYILRTYNPDNKEKIRVVIHIPTDFKHFQMLKDSRGKKSLSKKFEELLWQDIRNNSRLHGKPTII
jgi:hypothetical protein